jgi:hypothetical protein
MRFHAYIEQTSIVVAVVTMIGVALAPAASADPAAKFATNWNGTWRSGGGGGAATVHLDSADPIVGNINIPGVCTASWSETQRISATNRLVHAHVTSGPCVDNTWNVTFDPMTRLTGVDTQRADTTFSFAPSSAL